MAVIVTDGKSAEFLSWTKMVSETSDRVNKPVSTKNVFKGNKLASVSAGFTRFSKGTVLDWNYDFDEIIYMLKGRQRIESEGNTYIAKRGFCKFHKGIQINADIRRRHRGVIRNNHQI